MTAANRDSRRWISLIVLCLGVLMIVLDSTIVNVALPSIRADLGFTEISLVWVVNAYLLSFGGCLLLGGRLGDLFGQRRIFLLGIIVFTLASVACGLSTARDLLVLARALQGVGGAVVSAVSLSLIMTMFTEQQERAKAMGVYGFVCAAGGSLGVLLGGVLTSALSWHWIFLVNLPVGAAVLALSLRLIPEDTLRNAPAHLDVAGAATVTASLMLAVYAIVSAGEVGWLAARSLATLGAALVLMLAFLALELQVRAPLVPLGMFRLRSLAIANIVAVLWAAAMFAWFFISALYLQRVLGRSAMQIAFAFLPANLIMAVFSLGLSARIVTRFGIRPPLILGLLLAACGLACFAQLPAAGATSAVLAGMLLLGVGAGIAFNPLLLAAMSDVPREDSGLASGLVNTSFMMGGALGLAILASGAAARAASLARAGINPMASLSGGYHLAFAAGAGCAVIAAGLGCLLGRPQAARSARTLETASGG